MFKALILVAALLCVGCSSSHNTTKHSVWARYNPTFGIDDPKDGFFPNKSPRIGQRPYGARGMGGMRHRFKNGTSLKWGCGMANRHVGEVLIEVEKDI